jgi:hypothetical protein
MSSRCRGIELGVPTNLALRALTVLALLLTLGSLTVCSSDTGNQTDRTTPRLATAEPEGYPEEWRSSVTNAQAEASFQLLIPNSPLANQQNLTAVFVYPEGAAVAMQFPPAEDSAGKVRQDYLEVWESNWTGGDPLKTWNEDLDASPAEGKAIVDVGGIPALGVTANSASDALGSNAAFLRLVIGGTDVELSGGTSLDNLVEIAKTMIAATPTSTVSAAG